MARSIRLDGALATMLALVSACPADGLEIWRQQAKLVPEDGAVLNRYTHAVAVSGDAVINGSSEPSSQGAYVFSRSEGEWTEVAKLVPEDVGERHELGKVVSISGNTAMLGHQYDDQYGERSGAVFVFADTGAGWEQVAKLFADDAKPNGWFGKSVAVGGNRAVVGSIHRTDDERTFEAYVFEDTGSGWKQTAKLAPGVPAGAGNSGCSVAVSGERVIVGAQSAYGTDDHSGSAYIFEKTGSAWTQMAVLRPRERDPMFIDRFGESVAIDGDLAVVGAPWGHGIGQGAGSAHVFKRGPLGWAEQAELLPDTWFDRDGFGRVVDISGDTVVVGMSEDADGASPVYVFEDHGSGWAKVATLYPDEPERCSGFGRGVAIEGDTIFVTALGPRDSGPYGGVIHVFERVPLMTLLWDGHGDGDWAYVDPDSSSPRWVDAGGSAVVGPPDDSNAVIVRLDTVTISTPELAGMLNVESGTLRIGPTGSLEVLDQVRIGSGSAYVVELGGPAHGLLGAKGPVTIGPGATLGVEALGPLETLGRQTRTIITSPDHVSGTFTEIPATDEALGHGVFLRGIDYPGDAVELNVFQAAAGDPNADGLIDNADLQSILAAGSFGGGTGFDWTQGDFDGDRDVDNADLQLILATGLFNTGPYAATAVVPEPGTAMLLFTAMAALLAMAGWQRRSIG